MFSICKYIWFYFIFDIIIYINYDVCLLRSYPREIWSCTYFWLHIANPTAVCVCVCVSIVQYSTFEDKYAKQDSEQWPIIDHFLLRKLELKLLGYNFSWDWYLSNENKSISIFLSNHHSNVYILSFCGIHQKTCVEIYELRIFMKPR